MMIQIASRENDSNLLAEFRGALDEYTIDTFTRVHILLSTTTTSRAIFSRGTQLSRCSNFGFNSRKTLRHAMEN